MTGIIGGWKGGMAGVRVWKAGTSSLPSGEDINVVDTNEGDMSAQVACILVQNEGG